MSKIGRSLGKTMLNWRRVLQILAVYLILSFANVAIIQCVTNVGWNQSTWFAYEFATGADPYNFYTSEIGDNKLLWLWLLLFHIMSWLIVPILLGLVITNSIGLWENRKQRLRQSLIEAMSQEFESLAIEPAKAEELAIRAEASIAGRLAEKEERV